MDIFDLRVLRRVIAELPPAPAFLLNAFFPEVDESTEETIEFHYVKGRRRIAPFVSPLVAGKVVTGDGYEVNSFKPAYVKDKRVFDATVGFKRRVGEKIGGELTPEQRRQAALREATADQIDMLTRRFEVMAAEALLEGKQTITGDLYPTRVVDFKRKPGLRKVLVDVARWGEAGVNPIKNLEAWADEVFKASGKAPTDIVMTPDSWDLLKEFMAKDEAAQKLLDTKVRQMSTAMIDLGPVNVNGDGARLVGYLGNWRLWVYSDQYEDDNGAEVDVLPPFTVIMTSSGVEGVRHFGAIKDEKAGLQAMQFFQKSWVDEDPPVRWLLMQSAPLIVPYRVNATLGATVR
jgi:hypothetical protein